jgi:hypothetical protein
MGDTFIIMIFIFKNQAETKASYRAELPSGIRTETALFEALFVALRFPDYFGGNWNALEECIRDLSWLPPGDVILLHRDLPVRDDRASLSIYLSILKGAVEKWSTTGARNLFVFFPPKTKHAVESVLAEAENP